MIVRRPEADSPRRAGEVQDGTRLRQADREICGGTP